jgi:hypothetical protein
VNQPPCLEVACDDIGPVARSLWSGRGGARGDPVHRLVRIRSRIAPRVGVVGEGMAATAWSASDVIAIRDPRAWSVMLSRTNAPGA